MYICAHGYAVDFTYGDNGYKCCRPVYIQVCTVDKKVYTPLLKWQVSDVKKNRPRQIISERFPPLKG